MQMQCNMTGVVEHSCFESVGSALFAEGSLANHDCAPTCQFLFRFREGARPSLELQCVRDVEAGESLCISYGDLARPVWERRRNLQASHWFSCKCAKCMKDLTPSGLLKQLESVSDPKGQLLRSLFERSLPEEAEAAKMLQVFKALKVPFASTSADAAVSLALKGLAKLEPLEKRSARSNLRIIQGPVEVFCREIRLCGASCSCSWRLAGQAAAGGSSGSRDPAGALKKGRLGFASHSHASHACRSCRASPCPQLSWPKTFRRFWRWRRSSRLAAWSATAPST